MLPTGIDLERPGDYHKEHNNTPNVIMCTGDDATHNQNSAGAHHLNLNSLNSLEPHDVLEFQSKEEAFSFYKQYAKSVGFSIIIKASRRSRISGKFIDAKFVCTRYGNDPESEPWGLDTPLPTADIPVKKKRGRVNRSWSKSDCKAGMHVKRRQDGRWVVRSFIKEHNHDTFPDHAYYSIGHTSLDLGSNSSSVHTLHDIPGTGRTKKCMFPCPDNQVGRRNLRIIRVVTQTNYMAIRSWV